MVFVVKSGSIGQVPLSLRIGLNPMKEIDSPLVECGSEAPEAQRPDVSGRARLALLSPDMPEERDEED